MARKDLSDYLIHFTKDENYELAFKRLKNIIKEKTILGTSNKIKGGYNCVCFSEAPITVLKNGLVNPEYYSNYSPFGIMIKKEYIFAKAGRPVIYQTDNEFNQLPDNIRWRHVRYEPLNDLPIDFTWEREWRIKCSKLRFDEKTASIIVLNESWANRLINDHEEEQDYKILEYSLLFNDKNLAHLYYEPFSWNLILLQ
ncbi:MAG: hypothetical protein ACOC6D_08435 [Atribacterota bacterium]